MTDEDETPAQRQEALLEDSLAATLDTLRDLPESPNVRELRARAWTYRRAVLRWATVPPDQGQRDALQELVFDLHASALDTFTSEAATPLQMVRSVSLPKRSP
jgi:hypothetical protein